MIMHNMLKGHLKAYRFHLLMFYIVLLSEAGSMVYLPIMLSSILNKGPKSSTKDIIYLVIVALLWIMLIFAKDYLGAYLTGTISANIVAANVMKVTEAPLLELLTMKRVEAIYSINNLSYFLPFFYLIEISEMILAILKGLFIIMILFNLSVCLAMLVVLIVGLQFTLKHKLLNQNYKSALAAGEATNQFKQDTHTMLSQHKSIVINQMQRKITDEISFKKKNLLPKLKKQILWKTIDEGETNLFSNGVYLISILAVCFFLTNGRVQLGDYEICLSYILFLLECMESFFSGMQFKKQTEAQYQIYQNYSVTKEISEFFFEPKINHITIENLGFNYGSQKEILTNINQVFEKGKLYLIKGKNGTGKSTFINLICGLLTPTSGKIIVNEKNLEEWDKRKYLRTKIAISDQSTALFFKDINDNIALGDSIKSKNIKAIKKFWNLNSTNMEQQNNYSGGEIQKIGFARMMSRMIVYKPEILILDEPMNNLDSKSRKRILHFLNTAKKNHIVLVIAHDDSLDKLCNEIIVFESNL